MLDLSNFQELDPDSITEDSLKRKTSRDAMHSGQRKDQCKVPNEIYEHKERMAMC